MQCAHCGFRESFFLIHMFTGNKEQPTTSFLIYFVYLMSDFGVNFWLPKLPYS